MKKNTMKNSKRENVDETSNIIPLFLNEVDLVIGNMKKDVDNQCWRRILIRSVFSSIDCLCSRIKADTLKEIKNSYKRNKFTPGEISILEEQAYEVDTKGRVITRKVLLKARNNLRFTFNVVAKLTLDFELDVSGEGWASYLKAVKIRNRITHPKRIADLEVSIEEISIVKKAFSWFLDTCHEYLDGRIKYIQEERKNLAELKEKVKKLK